MNPENTQPQNQTPTEPVYQTQQPTQVEETLLTQILKRYNPGVKINYSDIVEIKSKTLFYVDTVANADKVKSENKVDKSDLDFGLKIITDKPKVEQEVKYLLVNKFFRTNENELNQLAYYELEELFSKIKQDQAELISFLKLNSLLGMTSTQASQ